MHFVVKWPSVKKPVKRASVENSRTPIPFFGSLSLHIGDKRFNEIALWLANINCAHRFEREKSLIESIHNNLKYQELCSNKILLTQTTYWRC
jgi:hypothetical protein